MSVGASEGEGEVEGCLRDWRIISRAELSKNIGFGEVIIMGVVEGIR